MGAYWQGLGNVTCRREESFQELFYYLGNLEAQDEIRSQSEVKHCKLLEADPNACTLCPTPENPYGPLEKSPVPLPKYFAARALVENRELVETAFELIGDFELGLLDLQTLSPEEIVTLKIVKEQQKFQMAKLQGEIIANQLAPLFMRGE